MERKICFMPRVSPLMETFRVFLSREREGREKKERERERRERRKKERESTTCTT